MKLSKLNPKKNKAQAIVEFALVLPILLLVVYGLIEAGRFLFIVSSVNNATRQAARYGSTSGVGPNGVPRYQDCDGIRAAAQAADFLNAFEDADITITYHNLDGTISFDGVCDGATDTNVTAVTEDRVTVSIDYDYNAIVPAIVPFVSRTMEAASSRTLLLTISVPPPKKPTVTTITSDLPDPSEIGQYVSVAVSVTASGSTPTGTVTIGGADENCTITLSGGAGSCNVRFTSVGAKTLTAAYGGDANHDSSSDTDPHVVNTAATTTVINSDAPDPSLPNQAVNVKVTVTSAWGTPTGAVVITGANTNCTITLSGGGTGNCNVTFTSIGSKTIIATYVGDTEHAASNDDENHMVASPGTTITQIIADSPDPSNVGQSVAVSVTVTGTTTPTGTVAITGADTTCTITLSGGTGSCNVVFNSLGAKTLTATYTPANPLTHNPSSDTESHTVALPATVTTITADTPDPSGTGQIVTVTVTVTGGATTPTGSVVITSSEGNFCTIPSLTGGTGSCTGIFNFSGSKTLTATYGGDSTHSGSSDTESHVVTASPVTGCNTVTVSLLKMVGGNLTIDIINPTTSFLQIGNVTLTWNHDKGHQTGGDKSLRLQSASLGSAFWNGDQAGETYTITPTSAAFVPPGTFTMTFSFHQTFDRWDNTEAVTISFSNPGCEGVTLYQNSH